MTNFLVKKFIPNYNDVNSPTVRRKYGVLSGIVGIIINILLFVAKFFVGLISSSIAVTADAFNNLSDACSSIITLVCFRMSDNPADKKHPFGHGRIEYISGLVISVVIIITGLEFTKSSIEKAFNPEPILFSYVSLYILLGSIILKLWLGLFNKKLGKMINSSAMKATAMDSLIDVVVTATVIVGMIINYFTGFCIDAYAGIIVALFILFTGINVIKETLDPLIGQAPSENFIDDVNKFVLSYENVIGVHDLMIHNYGPSKTIMSLHVEMPSNINIIQLHDTIDDIEKALKSKFKCQATIHLDPLVTDNEAIVNIREMLRGIVKEINSYASVHDLRIIPSNSHLTQLIFDVLIPYEERLSDNQIIEKIEETLSKNNHSYQCVIQVERSFKSNVSY